MWEEEPEKLMNTSARLLDIALRILGAGALALGLAFWLGYGRAFTRLHLALGIGMILCLWLLAGIAWTRTAQKGFVAFAVVWGVAVWILGMTQGRILIGPYHWLVEVAHLAVGAIAMGAGGQLAAAIAKGSAATTHGR